MTVLKSNFADIQEVEDITELKKDNSDMKVRIHRLELYIKLMTASLSSPDVVTAQNDIQAFEASAGWHAIVSADKTA